MSAMTGADRFSQWKMPEIRDDGSTVYGWHVHPKYKGKFMLGEKTDIGFGTYIQPQYGVEIGAGVQIGSHCSIYSVSTIDGKCGKVVIQENALIGAHSTIMPGVTIGAGATVGAYSFVKTDIPAGALAYGIPARLAKRRT